MEKIFLCSHGFLANGLLRAAETIIGTDRRVKALALDEYEAPSRIAEEVGREISNAEACAILCDIKGGSIHNALMQFCQRPGVYLMTGMNLAMAIDLISAPEDIDLESRCRQALEYAGQDQVFFDQEYVKTMLEWDEDDEF